MLGEQCGSFTNQGDLCLHPCCALEHPDGQHSTVLDPSLLALHRMGSPGTTVMPTPGQAVPCSATPSTDPPEASSALREGFGSSSLFLAPISHQVHSRILSARVPTCPVSCS